MKHIHSRSAFWFASLAALLILFQGCAAKAPRSQQEGALTPISSVKPVVTNDKMELVIEGEQPLLQYTSFQLTEPYRLVVDITDASIGKFRDRISINQGSVTDVNPTQVDNVARLEIGLTQPAEARVYQSGGKVIVEFGKGQRSEVAKTEAQPAPAAAAEPASPPAAPAEQAPASAAGQPEAGEKKTEQAPAAEEKPATMVTAATATASGEGITIVITGNGAMKPKTFMLKDGRIVVDIPGVKSKVKSNVIPVRKGGVTRVRIAQFSDKVVRAVLDVTKPMQYAATAKDNTIIIAVNAAEAPKPAEASKTEEKPQAEAAMAAPAPSPAEKEASVSQEAPVAAPTPAAAPAVAPAAAMSHAQTTPAAPAITETTIGGGRFSGRRISLDFQDADLVNVMRLFAEVANLNVILSPDVKGKVTVRMVNIPWDQAMDIILKMNGLGFTLEDNILRIATLPALAKEADEEMKAKEAKKKAEDLYTRVISVNYATAKNIEATIKKSLSARGETVVDERTNTIIVKDAAANLDDIVSLVKTLDRPTAQVMIEARIVEATLNFNQSIGVQWGGLGQMSAATGNPTGYRFPNSISVTGGPTMGIPPSGIGNFIVNLPAAAGTTSGGAAIGFQFGSLTKALNLDLVLSALESTGEGKVISQPRVSALDNQEAKIEQGLSIPFSTVSASGTQIQFIDAKLALTVTPHVTPDNKIFMKIEATRNAPDTSLLGASGQPSIRKNEAKTQILLADGETTVIGGILTIDRSTNLDKIPFFGDIPIIGWLFTKKTTTETKRELLIFLTPKLVKQETV